MSDPGQGEGRQAFLWLAALVLGGLIFAAGVMVGRGLGQPPPVEGGDPLTRLDARTAPVPPPPEAPDGGALEFPRALEGPPVEPPRRPAPPAPAPDAGQGSRVDGEDGGASAAAPAPAGPTPWLCLQVASFREAEQAEALAGRLRAAGYPEVRVGAAEAGSKGTYHRVMVGRYPGREPAEQARERLSREERLEALVRTCEP